MAARRLSEAQWREIIQTFEDCDSIQEAFASEYGVPISSFRARLYRLRKSSKHAEAEFVEVRPKAAVIQGSSVDEQAHRVCIEAADGIRIVFDHLPSMQYLAELALRLSGHRAC